MTVTNDDKVANILKEAFFRRKKENKYLSFRMMAKRLDASVSLISQIMNGKRSLKLEMIEEFSKILDLNTDQYDELVRLLMTKKKVRPSPGLLRHADAIPSKSQIDVEWVGQPRQNFWVLQDWHYLAILDATYLSDCDGTPAYFAKKLNLDLEVATEALEDLMNEGLLVLKDNRLQKAENYNSFQSKASRKEILGYHKSVLRKSLDTLETQTEEWHAEQRLVNSMTLTVPNDKIPWAKQQLSNCLKSIAIELSNGPEEQIYQLAIQFIPLTTREPEIK